MSNITLCELCPVYDECDGNDCIYDTPSNDTKDNAEVDPWDE